MQDKIGVNDDARIMFKDFQKTYPTLSKQVVHFYQDRLCTLVVYLKDGTKLLYDYNYGRATRLRDRWKLDIQ